MRSRPLEERHPQGTTQAEPAPPAAPRPAARTLETLPALRAQSAAGGSAWPAPPDGDAGQVMLQFQRLMHRFLETQQQVMLAYLQGATDGASSPTGALPVPEVPEPVFDLAAGEDPVQMPQPAAPEPAAARPVSAPIQASSAPAPVRPEAALPVAAAGPQPALDREGLTRTLLQIVSERTGYPPDMLGLDLNIEADLGIDSIKRVEILGALQQAFAGSGQPPAGMEELTRIKTLRGIIDRIGAALCRPADGPVAGSTPLPPGARGQQTPAGGDDGGPELARFAVRAVETPLGSPPRR